MEVLNQRYVKKIQRNLDFMYNILQTKLKKSQPVFPLVRGRCGQRFALPNGAPAKCDPR